MYNLKINGQRVTNLRLSGENVSKIFTSAITSWDDPALVADNPGLVMPKRKIVPVVRSDGSGSIDVVDVKGDFTVDRDGSGGIDHERVGGKVRIPRD